MEYDAQGRKPSVTSELRIDDDEENRDDDGVELAGWKAASRNEARTTAKS